MQLKLGYTSEEAVSIVLEHRHRFIGCSSSETFLRQAVLSHFEGSDGAEKSISLRGVGRLDGFGKQLFLVMAYAENLYSWREDWHAFVMTLRAIENGTYRPEADQSFSP